MSRQSAYQARMKAEHRCGICGQPAEKKRKGGFYVDCTAHRLARKTRNKRQRRMKKLAEGEL